MPRLCCKAQRYRRKHLLLRGDGVLDPIVDLQVRGAAVFSTVALGTGLLPLSAEDAGVTVHREAPLFLEAAEEMLAGSRDAEAGRRRVTVRVGESEPLVLAVGGVRGRPAAVGVDVLAWWADVMGYYGGPMWWA